MISEVTHYTEKFYAINEYGNGTPSIKLFNIVLLTTLKTPMPLKKHLL